MCLCSEIIMILLKSHQVSCLRRALFPKVEIKKCFGTQLKYDIEENDFIKLDIFGELLKFPHVWLRDNCQCDQCFHSSAKSRIIDWSKFNLNIKPKQVIKNKNLLQITWEDEHISQYAIEWLKLRSFSTKNHKLYTETIYRPKKIIWNSNDFKKIFTKHDYKTLLNNEQHLLNWLIDLSTYGVALIQNTPPSETALDNLVDKVGFAKRTHYGNKYVVQQVTNTNNVAYLASNLQLHTDLPYYEYCPGVNFLHCLTQTSGEGGANLLIDSFSVANYMKEHHPEQYRLLTDIEVEWSDIGIEQGNEFYKLYRSPIISLNKHGEVYKVNFSTPQRGSHFPIPIETVKPWYEAQSLFFHLSLKFASKYKTNVGDILMFDNTRLLHGRNKYEDKPTNVRKLIGAHIDWDEMYSRLRCLKIKLKQDNFLK